MRAELDNIHAGHARRQRVSQQFVIGDLISYQNDGKCSTAIVGKVARA
jgi:hypothetical protein